MRTAIGATAINIAKPTNLGVPMIRAFLDNIRYITIELNGLTLYGTRDDVPCDIDEAGDPRGGRVQQRLEVGCRNRTSEVGCQPGVLQRGIGDTVSVASQQIGNRIPC